MPESHCQRFCSLKWSIFKQAFHMILIDMFQGLYFEKHRPRVWIGLDKRPLHDFNHWAIFDLILWYWQNCSSPSCLETGVKGFQLWALLVSLGQTCFRIKEKITIKFSLAAFTWYFLKALSPTPLSQEAQVISDHTKGRLLRLWLIKLLSKDHST